MGDRIVILDSFLEILVTFVFAPILTIVLWAIAAGIAIGLFFVHKDYSQREGVSGTTFATNSIMVGLSLIKMTGDISQYIVLYRASLIAKEKGEERGNKEVDKKH